MMKLKYLSKYFILPQRVIFGIMGFFIIGLTYVLQSICALAITEMVIKNRTESFQAECSTNVTTSIIITTEYKNKADFDWSEELQGMILSSYFWGYILTQIPAGMLASKYGGKNMIVVGVLVTIFFTFLTPTLVVRFGASAFMICRFLIGIGQGVINPAYSVLIAAWTPLSERSTMVTIVFAGSQIGSVLGSIIVGEILHAYRWPAAFYFGGIVVSAWVVLFFLLCYDSPDTHPFISDKEKQYLTKELGTKIDSKNYSKIIPWRHILTSVPVWSLILIQIGQCWAFYILVCDLNKYFSDVLNLPVNENGFYSSLPFAMMWLVAIGTGFFSDFVIHRNYLSVTSVRKIFTFLSSIIPAICMVIASYSGCNKFTAITMFTFGTGAMGAFYTGTKANNLDLSPNYTGVIMALSNGIGSISGSTVPYIVGVITTNRLISEWKIVFWLSLAVNVVATAIFLIFGSGEVQSWNDIEYKTKQSKTKNNFNLGKDFVSSDVEK